MEKCEFIKRKNNVSKNCHSARNCFLKNMRKFRINLVEHKAPETVCVSQNKFNI